MLHSQHKRLHEEEFSSAKPTEPEVPGWRSGGQWAHNLFYNTKFINTVSIILINTNLY